MSNGIYTALDYDIDYLAHYQKKGAKWGQHIFGPPQNPKKYSKGLLTKGLDWADKTASKLEKYAEGKKTFGKNPDSANKAYEEYKKESSKRYKNRDWEAAEKYGEAAKAWKQEAENRQYNKNTRVRRTLVGAAAKVIRGGMKAAVRTYRNLNHVKNFITNPRYRKAKLREFGHSIKKKANDFVTAVKGAFNTAVNNVKSAVNNFKFKRQQSAARGTVQRNERPNLASETARKNRIARTRRNMNTSYTSRTRASV